MIEHYGSWKPQALAILKTLAESADMPTLDLSGAEVRPDTPGQDSPADVILDIWLPRMDLSVRIDITTSETNELGVISWEMSGTGNLRCPSCRAVASIGRESGMWELTCRNMTCGNAESGLGFTLTEAWDSWDSRWKDKYFGARSPMIAACGCGCGQIVENHYDQLVFIDPGLLVSEEIMWLEWRGVLVFGVPHDNEPLYVNGRHIMHRGLSDQVTKWMHELSARRENICPMCGHRLSSKRSREGIAVLCANSDCPAVSVSWHATSLRKARLAARVAISAEAQSRCPACNEMVHLTGGPAGWTAECRAPDCVRSKIGHGTTPETAYADLLVSEPKVSK